ncbi:MAG TPA: PIN domain-containing protein [Caulobacteraceae bacterium]|nr:PIN domain-containing protein [Caulobacteraceae bacterium]
MIHLDTHVVIWLAERRERALSVTARRTLDREPIGISAMVLLELETLREAGKLKNEPDRIVGILERNMDLSRSAASLGAVADAARTFAWTRDPFDRLIVANAMADGVKLLTADETILRHFEDAVW